MLVKHNMSAPNAIYKNKNDPSMKVTFRDLKRYEDYKSKIKNFVVQQYLELGTLEQRNI